MFYRVANLPIEKVCIMKNFEEANFSDFKRLVVNLKINPQKYNCPQKTCKSLNNTFPGSKISGRNMKNFDFSSCATTGATLVEIRS